MWPKRSVTLSHSVAWTGMLFALALALSVFESLLPPLPSPVPLRYGLSNLAVMYALFFLNTRSGVTIACLKGVFALMTRGPFAGAVSLGGGLVSVAVMALLYAVSHSRLSYTVLSVSGALAHNIGQLAVAFLILAFPAQGWALVPMMSLIGLGTGVLSAALLKPLVAALNRVAPDVSSSRRDDDQDHRSADDVGGAAHDALGTTAATEEAWPCGMKTRARQHADTSHKDQTP